MSETIKIYVASSSAELERAQAAMDRVRSWSPRFELTRDWTADVEHERASGKLDSDLKHSERAHYARADLGAVAEADILWLLVPREGVHTSGAWVELGAALVAGHMREALGLRNTTIICSGEMTGHYRFTSLADHVFELDSEAFDWFSSRSV